MKNLLLIILTFSAISSANELSKEPNLNFPGVESNQTTFLTGPNIYNFTTTTKGNHAIVSGENGDLEIWSDQKNKKINQNQSLTQFKFTSQDGYILEGLETINLKKGTRNFMIGSNDGFIEFEQFINVSIKNKSITNNDEKPWIIKTNIFSLNSVDLLEEYKKNGINFDELQSILKEHSSFSNESSHKAYQAIQLLGGINSDIGQKDFTQFEACVSAGFSFTVSYLAYAACAVCVATEGLAVPACNTCRIELGATVLAITGVLSACGGYLADVLPDPYAPDPILDPTSPDGYYGPEGYVGPNRIPIWGDATVCSDDTCWTVKVIIGYIYLLY